MIKTHKSYCIPDISKEEKWRNKEVAQRLGIHSGLIVRVPNPHFLMKKTDPGEGGEITIQCYCKEEWATAEIINTGQISEEKKEEFLMGKTSGRGLHIISRLVKSMGGKVEVDTKEGQTTFRVLLPVAEPL